MADNLHATAGEPPRIHFVTLGIFVALAFVPALIGAGFPPGEWYQGLTKPTWHPPQWLFAPVWTVLYLMIGASGYLAYSARAHRPRREVRDAFSVFALQLVLNALWTPLFFGLRSPGLALLDILALAVAIALNIALFYRIRQLAAWLLTPYLLWVIFAAALNAAILWLNL